MTERPFAGYLLAVFFLLAGVGYLVAPFAVAAIEFVYLGAYAVVVVAYLHSSIRLMLRPAEEFEPESQVP